MPCTVIEVRPDKSDWLSTASGDAFEKSKPVTADTLGAVKGADSKLNSLLDSTESLFAWSVWKTLTRSLPPVVPAGSFVRKSSNACLLSVSLHVSPLMVAVFLALVNTTCPAWFSNSYSTVTTAFFSSRPVMVLPSAYVEKVSLLMSSMGGAAGGVRSMRKLDS